MGARWGWVGLCEASEGVALVLLAAHSEDAVEGMDTRWLLGPEVVCFGLSIGVCSALGMSSECEWTVCHGVVLSFGHAFSSGKVLLCLMAEAREPLHQVTGGAGAVSATEGRGRE